MPIADQVTEQMKQAMKAKDERRLVALRSMRSAFLNEMKKDGSTSISDAVCEGLLRKLEKQRKESIEAFSNAGREELAAAERAELAVIQEFLPKLADEAKVREWVEAAIAQAGATSGEGHRQGHGRPDEGPQRRDRRRPRAPDRAGTAGLGGRASGWSGSGCRVRRDRSG